MRENCKRVKVRRGEDRYAFQRGKCFVTFIEEKVTKKRRTVVGFPRVEG